MTVPGSECATETNPSKSKNTWHHVRKYLREYSEVTGIQGLRYVTEKRTRVEKIFWAIILLISMIGCIYMIFEIVDKFQSSPVVVSFATRDTPVYEIPFAAVTICPESKSTREIFSYSAVFKKYRRNETLSDQELKHFEYLNVLCDIVEDDYLHGGNKTVDNDFFEVLDVVKAEIEMYCIFMDEKVYIDGRCKDILTPIITDQGICYTFNMIDRSEIFKDHVVHYGDFHNVGYTSQYDGEFGYNDDADIDTYPKRALMSGADNSLEIFMLSHRDDNDFICNTYHQGVRVLIHNPFDMPQLTKNYFRAPFDTVTVVAVHPHSVTTSNEVRYFNPGKRKCYLRSERPLKHFKVYTQLNCLLECETNFTLKRCGCVSFYMPRDNQTAICGIGSQDCVEQAESELKLAELKKKIHKTNTQMEETNCDCQPLCTELEYNVETSRSAFQWKDFYDANSNINMTNTDNETEFAHSVLSIYFKKEQFITLERNELYGISDLISNFGGILGLFTGFSLITLAEIIYFVTLRIFYNNRLYGTWSGLPV